MCKNDFCSISNNPCKILIKLYNELIPYRKGRMKVILLLFIYKPQKLSFISKFQILMIRKVMFQQIVL